MTSFLAGDILTADGLNLRPFYYGYQATGATQSILSSGWYPITMTGEVSDTLNGHSTSVNTSRYTPSVPGLYFCTGNACFAPGAAGKFCAIVRRNGIEDNGGRYGSGMADAAGPANNCQCSATIRCNGTTDYVELHTYQLFGGTTLTAAGPGYSSYLICEWVAP